MDLRNTGVAMAEEMKRFMEEKDRKRREGMSNLGGPVPTDEQKAEAIDVEFPLAKGKTESVNYKDELTLDQGGQPAAQSWFDKLGDMVRDPNLPESVQFAGQTAHKLTDMLVVSPYKAIEALLNPQGYLPGAGDEQAVARSTEAAGAVGGASSLVPVPKGAFRVFGGRQGAEYAASKGHGGAKEMLDIADSLHLSGHSDFTIREILREASEASGLGGWTRGKEGAGQFEISDANINFKVPFDKLPDKFQGKLGQIISHPELEKFYPELADMPITIEKGNPKLKGYRPTGGYDPEATGRKGMTIRAQNSEQFLDVLTHEVDHALADIELHAAGANPKSIKNVLLHTYNARRMEVEDLVSQGLAEPSELKKLSRIIKDIESSKSQDLYVRSSGENRANASQKRREMTAPERLDIDPKRHENATREWQIEHSFGEAADYWAKVNREADSSKSMSMESSPLQFRGEINDRIRALNRRINIAQSQIEVQSRRIKEGRYSPVETQRRQEAVMKNTDKLQKLISEKESLGEVVKKLNLTPETRETAVRDISQRAPKTGTEDVGSMGKRRSKLDRLREDAESLQSIIDNEKRPARVTQARKRLDSVNRQISEIVE